ncbi:MAG TPA: beta-ketoacyl-ACP synthase III [Gemmatimonadaceae bacterium]|nr:beta-ketoacyl-ACP synthase III [Gemmatimonadaceae bacterium]
MKRPTVQISGLGRSVPARVMTNYDFAAIGIETTHEWVMERTGISERHIAGPEDSTCSMGAKAARIAMQRAGVQPGEIDIIICSTATPDRLLPATAVDIQASLGASRAAAFDISAACCGFLYGMTMAEGLIQSGAAETVLLVSSEKLSAITDWTDRATCVLFGDGAGAAVLRRSQKGRGILSTFMRSDGTLADLLYRPAGGATTPMSPAVLEARTHLIHMAGREVFKHAVRSMAESADRALDMARINSGDIDLLIPHQANLRIIEATAKHASIPMSKVYVNVDRYGNTSSASIPIALDEATQKGLVGEGSLVLMLAFGAGFTWASSVVRL